ncbi:hypothetical protein LN042_33710 [Kitasatospora sp. RB6PN24]|uniref:hypothetical protein n=1 Tax=Kitasatospora humi TaxID=2893891 RepID=UPI001E47EBB1|nr:hypothetical protein [Kitasatospora humi]MCC9311962.1 hypothetical protein [Kitasatospora humi]
MSDQSKGQKIEVRGSVDAAKYHAAKALGGENTMFELRAMKPNRGSNAAAITCVVCLICIVCSAASTAA